MKNLCKCTKRKNEKKKTSKKYKRKMKKVVEDEKMECYKKNIKVSTVRRGRRLNNDNKNKLKTKIPENWRKPQM